MTEWTFTQQDPSEQLCQLHFFAITKRQPAGDIEFRITLKEYVTPPDPAMKFFAQADKQTNQRTTPYTPVGWGITLMDALSECIRAIHRFPYEG